MCSYFQHTVNIYSSNIDWNVTYSAGEPGFPIKCAKPKAGEGGEQPIIRSKFPRKLHEDEEKIGQRK